MNEKNDLKLLQKKLLVLLLNFEKLCQTYNLKFSISDGTLLGAIRHKGFIPWDDDVDVLMERDEYEKLKSIKSDEFDIQDILWIPRLTFRDQLINPKGIYIDILVYDKVPTSNLRQKLKVFSLRFLQGAMKKNIDLNRYSIKQKLLVIPTYLVGKFFSRTTLLSYYEKICKMDKTSNNTHLCCYKNLYRSMAKTLPISCFESYKYINFEHTKLPAIVGWDQYLTKYYGDYMTPPSQEEQVPTHGNINKI